MNDMIDMEQMMVQSGIAHDLESARQRLGRYEARLRREAPGNRKTKKAHARSILEAMKKAGISIDRDAATVALERLGLRGAALSYAFELAMFFPYLRNDHQLLRLLAWTDEQAEANGATSTSGAFGTILNANLAPLTVASRASGDDDATLKLASEVLEHAMRNSTEATRRNIEAWRMCEVDGSSPQEAATTLKMNVSQVSLARHRARQHIITATYELTHSCAAPAHGYSPADYEHVRAVWVAGDDAAMARELEAMKTERATCPHFLNWSGILMERLGDPQTALSLYHQAYFHAQDDETRGKVSHNIGCLHSSAGEHDDARSAWLKARSETPYSPAPAISLAIDACLNVPEMAPPESQTVRIEKCLGELLKLVRSPRVSAGEKAYIAKKLRADERLLQVHRCPRLAKIADKICRLVDGQTLGVRNVQGLGARVMASAVLVLMVAMSLGLSDSLTNRLQASAARPDATISSRKVDPTVMRNDRIGALLHMSTAIEHISLDLSDRLGTPMLANDRLGVRVSHPEYSAHPSRKSPKIPECTVA